MGRARYLAALNNAGAKVRLLRNASLWTLGTDGRFRQLPRGCNAVPFASGNPRLANGTVRPKRSGSGGHAEKYRGGSARPYLSSEHYAEEVSKDSCPTGFRSL